ncbi:hypothetical protein QBC46DRAFT_220361, partial [Diplogelasinospora grovesii]
LPARPDDRIFIRVDAERAGIDKFTIRQFLVSNIGISLQDVPKCQPIKTGFAITPATPEVSKKLLESASTIMEKLGVTGVEKATHWHTYIVAGCPRQVRVLDPESGHLTLQDSIQLVGEEVIAQTGQKPINIHMGKKSHTHSPNITYIVSLTAPTERSWRLFGSSAMAKLVTKKTRITKCNPGCLGFHNARDCARKKRCVECGQQEHLGECSRPTQCANCLGPYRGNHEGCPAGPI